MQRTETNDGFNGGFNDGRCCVHVACRSLQALAFCAWGQMGRGFSHRAGLKRRRRCRPQRNGYARIFRAPLWTRDTIRAARSGATPPDRDHRQVHAASGRGEWAAHRPQRRHDLAQSNGCLLRRAQSHPAQHANAGQSRSCRFVSGQAADRDNDVTSDAAGRIYFTMLATPTRDPLELP